MTGPTLRAWQAMQSASLPGSVCRSETAEGCADVFAPHGPRYAPSGPRWQLSQEIPCTRSSSRGSSFFTRVPLSSRFCGMWQS